MPSPDAMPSHSERSVARKRKATGAASSGSWQRRVRTKNITNGAVVDRVLCPFYKRFPEDGQWPSACHVRGFAEVAKLRDHLKGVHFLPKDKLDELNFKNARFRNLSLEEKWKLCFTTLFPEVAKDEVPAPWKNSNNNNNNNNRHIVILPPQTEASGVHEINAPDNGQFDFNLLRAQLLNWIFERLSAELGVPQHTKYDLMANFEIEFERILGRLRNGSGLGTVSPSQIIPSRTGDSSPEELAPSAILDDFPTPAFDLMPSCDWAAYDLFDPAEVNLNANLDNEVFDGLPNSPLSSAIHDTNFSFDREHMDSLELYGIGLPTDTDAKPVYACQQNFPAPQSVFGAAKKQETWNSSCQYLSPPTIPRKTDSTPLMGAAIDEYTEINNFELAPLAPPSGYPYATPPNDIASEVFEWDLWFKFPDNGMNDDCGLSRIN